MHNVLRRFLAVVLVVGLLVSSNISVYAATDEEYICEMRLIYADTFKEAKNILADTEFKDYQVLNENLNEDSGEIGVWLAYKTTTDIEDAITDISVMQMNGGYQEGNYQEMIKESFEEYTAMSNTYLEAIDYFVLAYDAGHFLADAAYRQLNLYTAITDEDLGITVPDFSGERLGDIFYNGIDADELATIFMQGNTYALQNIRSLLAMGVSYNEDGTHYLEKVAQHATAVNAGNQVQDDGSYDEISLIISGTILTLQKMFKELALYEPDMNYYDQETTELELQYAEHKSLADRMREVAYLNGKTLYQFCLDFTLNKSDLSSLYPLVASLNNGQKALTKVGHYYDVVRYSMSDYPEDVLDEMIREQEVLHENTLFDVYTGVDRNIYYGSFALTSAAYRADAYTEEGFLNFMFKEHAVWTASAALSMTGGAALSIWAIRRTLAAKQAAQQLQQDAATQFALNKQAAIDVAQQAKLSASIPANQTVSINSSSLLGNTATQYGATYNDVANALIMKYNVDPIWLDQPLNVKLVAIMGKYDKMSAADVAINNHMNADFVTALRANEKLADQQLQEALSRTQTVTETSTFSGFTMSLYIVGGLLMLYSVINVALTVHFYYNPDYDDIPVAMVDLIETEDGDRYIKYDAVLEAEARKNGYTPGDLNAFEAQRWNALYYTKSYEAGKPLLADEFSVSNTNNKPRTNYSPVHRFGEVVCYDLNKYNFDDDTSIYLSVKQSKNQKAAVTEVPELIGSMFSDGIWILIAGAGAVIGVGGTLGTEWLLKKKKAKTKSVCFEEKIL